MDVGKCQTAAATPAKPGDLPRWVRTDSLPGHRSSLTLIRPSSATGRSREGSNDAKKCTHFEESRDGSRTEIPKRAATTSGEEPSSASMVMSTPWVTTIRRTRVSSGFRFKFQNKNRTIFVSK